MPRTMDDFLNDLNRDPQLRRAFEDAVAAFARKQGYLVEAKDVEVAGLGKKDKGDQPKTRDLDNEGPTMTSMALGEEDSAPRASVTLAIGEEDRRRAPDGPVATTLAMGEEDKKPTLPRIDATTLALGEEDKRRGTPKKGGPKPK